MTEEVWSGVKGDRRCGVVCSGDRRGVEWCEG